MPVFPWTLPGPTLVASRRAWQDWMRFGSVATATWLAAAEVVSLRLPMIALAGLTGDKREVAELHRMVAEKPGAFLQAWEIMAWRLAAGPIVAQTAALAPLRRRAEANARRLRR